MIASGYLKDVKAKEVFWLWKPYIAFGKVTLIQCDTGDGGIIVLSQAKTALIKALWAEFLLYFICIIVPSRRR